MAAGVTVQGNTQGVNPVFLSAVLRAIQAVGGTQLRVTSGYRDPAHNQAAGGVSGSAHLTGHALDGDVYIPGRGWVPLGTALAGVAGRFGLRSGDQPGFFHGGRDPVHVDDRVATTTSGGGGNQTVRVTGTQPFPQGVGVADYVGTRALALGLDPYAVLAVARSEGGLSAQAPPGDHGTSFGPFQLHIGGALPPGITKDKAQAWAWSPAGIDYALTRMTRVAAGQRGVAAIRNIVTGFERPADPGGEITRATAYYHQQVAAAVTTRTTPGQSGNGFWSDVTGVAGNMTNIVAGAASTFLPSGTGVTIPGTGVKVFPGLSGIPNAIPGVGGVTSTLDFLQKLTDPSYILRGLQIVAGAGLVGVGTLLLVRQVALASDLPDPLQAAAAAASRGMINTGPSGQGGTPEDTFAIEPGSAARRPRGGARRANLRRPAPVRRPPRRGANASPGEDIPF